MLQVADRRTKGQQGFTLIEIIAVLVILGILAVVAVPKYVDLQDKAKEAAAKGLVAAAQSELSMAYAAYKLNSQANTDLTYLCSNTTLGISGGSSGSASVTCAGANWVTKFATITATVDSGSGINSVGYWNSPEAK